MHVILVRRGTHLKVVELVYVSRHPLSCPLDHVVFTQRSRGLGLLRGAPRGEHGDVELHVLRPLPGEVLH